MPDSPISTVDLRRDFRPRLFKRGGSSKISAVAGITLDVPEGSIYGLVGPNGAGKTTLMRLILGLLRPTSGEVRLLGARHSWGGSPALRHVGALIEEPRFFPKLSGRENLLQIAMLIGREAERTVGEALSNVGLSSRADDPVKSYSLGMRQRLGLARCLLGHPRVLVLDEPTNGMDPQGIASTRRLLTWYSREFGATVLLSSHHLHAMEQLCDHVAFMSKGQIVKSGTMTEIALPHRSYRLRTERAAEAATVVRALAADAEWGLRALTADDDRVAFSIEGEHDVSAITRALFERGHDLVEFTQVNSSLEAVYLDHIGHGHGIRGPE